MNIGNKIIDLIADNDITQKELALKLGISPATLNGYIKNRREPDCETIVKIASYFNVSCDFLLGNTSVGSNLDKLSPYLIGKEKTLLNSYGQLSEKNKDLLLSISAFLVENN